MVLLHASYETAFTFDFFVVNEDNIQTSQRIRVDGNVVRPAFCIVSGLYNNNG